MACGWSLVVVVAVALQRTSVAQPQGPPEVDPTPVPVPRPSPAPSVTYSPTPKTKNPTIVPSSLPTVAPTSTDDVYMTLISGSCVVSGRCFSSPNYPSAYGSGSCVLQAIQSKSEPLVSQYEGVCPFCDALSSSPDAPPPLVSTQAGLSKSPISALSRTRASSTLWGRTSPVPRGPTGST